MNDRRKKPVEGEHFTEKEHSDDELVERIRLGDEKAAELLINRYYAAILRYCRRYCRSLHAAVLLIVCLMIIRIIGIREYIPAFMPLFVLAAMPAMFRCQYYGMGEIEAATRASGPQIVLAKLILAGASDLICMTVLIFFETHFQNTSREIGQLILYCLVPYLICMSSMLRLIRLRRRENMQVCTVLVLSSCIFWGMLAKAMPRLYDTSAFGIWIAAFLFFAAFFIKEIAFIISMGKEGKMYGIIV